jgi:hypothetical protein
MREVIPDLTKQMLKERLGHFSSTHYYDERASSMAYWAGVALAHIQRLEDEIETLKSTKGTP